jgi:uracil-DNA glycosylase family 4
MAERDQPKDRAHNKIPSTRTLSGLARIATNCRACDLWQRGTQTVFGEGEPHTKITFVDEVPGDHEARQGKPLMGPAGRLLDRALTEANIDRSKVYVTNAVKHFSWEPRGKRRIHKRPSAVEVAACRP